MTVIVIVWTLVAAASAAPTIGNGANEEWQREFIDNSEFNNRLFDGYRGQRSNYGSLYMSPCAAAAASAPVQAYGAGAASGLAHGYGIAASAPAQAYAQAASVTPYSYNHAAYQMPAHTGHPSSYQSYGHPYYRSEEIPENDQEILGFSDMNPVPLDHHVPMARYAYGGAPAQGDGVGAVQASAGPVVGVFPNANTGGCSVPLLVSCSPSIAQGRIVKAQPYGGASSAYQGVYRVVEEHPHHEDTETHQEKAAQSTENSNLNSKTTGDSHQ